MDDKSLKSRASQETLVSLLQLDPTPMDSTPDATTADNSEKQLPSLPEEQQNDLSSSGTSSLGLSGSGHGAIYYLTRIQRYSSYTLSIFTSLHLANTSLIPMLTRSVPASESYLLLAREIYQTRLSEPLLVGLPIVAHVASGVALRLLRRAQNLRWYGDATPDMFPLEHASATSPAPSAGGSRVWPSLSYISLSGYATTVFVLSHAFLNRVLPLAVEGDSANIGLAYVSHGFARHGALSWLAYVGLLGIGCGHMVWGWAKWLGLSQSAGWTGPKHVTGNARVDKQAWTRRRRLWLGMNGVALAAAGLWAAGGLGIVARAGRTEGWVGKVYDGLYEKVGM